MPSAVILGAGPGLGLASARAFATAGLGVGLVARSAAALEEAAERMRGDGARVATRPVDVSDAAGLTAALQEIAAELGDVRVLHHNVGRLRAGGVDLTTAGDLAADLATGTVSLLTAVRALLPRLDGGGSVVVTGGGSADRPGASYLTLGVQKAAVRALTLAIAADLGPRGITVRTLTIRGLIAPGTDIDPDRIARRIVELAADHDPAVPVEASWPPGATP